MLLYCKYPEVLHVHVLRSVWSYRHGMNYLVLFPDCIFHAGQGSLGTRLELCVLVRLHYLCLNSAREERCGDLAKFVWYVYCKRRTLRRPGKFRTASDACFGEQGYPFHSTAPALRNGKGLACETPLAVCRGFRIDLQSRNDSMIYDTIDSSAQ